MTQPGRIWGTLCLLGMVVLCPGRARAQEAGVPQAGPGLGSTGNPTGGNGFKVGNGRLHPFLDIESRLDSGAGYFPPTGVTDGTLSPDLSGELLLHIRPGMKLEVPSPKVDLNFYGNVDYVMYTGLLTPNSGAASHVEGQANLSARFNTEGPVGFSLSDDFERSDRTRTAAVGAGVLSLFNELRASAPVKPGGGAIEITPEVAWAMEFFHPLGAQRPVGCDQSECDPLTLETFDYNNVRASLDGRWRFLPKTAVIVDTDFDLRSYFQGTSPSAQLLRAQAGLAGLVSPKISVTAKLGWGMNFGATGGGTLIGQLEGVYLYSPTMTFKGGFLRTLEPVSSYGLMRDDRGYVEARSLLGGRLAVHGALAFDALHFLGTTLRSDSLFTLDAGPEYQFRPWLVGSAGYLLNLRSSSANGAGLNYSRNEGYVRLSVSY